MDAPNLPPHLAATESFDAEFLQTRMPDPNAPSEAPLRERFGEYEIVRVIGKGGMGQVFEARHVLMGLPVAIKTLRTGENATEIDIQRFVTEARAVAELHQHPNIVKIHDIAQRDGQYYIIMQLIRGGSLSDRLQEYIDDPKLAAPFMIKVVDAITQAHHRGILHRDLKPDNILVDDRGIPYVTDFGLAKRVVPGAEEKSSETPKSSRNYQSIRSPSASASDYDSGSTLGGSLLGTPSFMPPEQAKGDLKDISTFSDVYSLGATLFCMLAGRPPFLGKSIQRVLEQVINDRPPSLRRLNPKVDADLEAICFKALEKAPHDRYESTEMFARDLVRWTEGRTVHAREVRFWERATKWVKREPVKATAAGLATIVLFLSAFAAVKQRGLERTRLAAEVERLQNEKEITAARTRDLEQKAKIESQSIGLKTAGQAVQNFIDAIESEIGSDVQQQELRRKFLNQAIEYYSNVITGHKRSSLEDDEGRLELAKAHSHVADLNGKLGTDSYETVIDNYSDAIEVLAKLQGKLKEESRIDSVLAKRVGLELGNAHHESGVIHSSRGKPLDALTSFSKGREVRESICDPCPSHGNARECGCAGDIAARAGLGRSHGYLGDIYRSNGRLSDAIAAYDRSHAIRKKLFEDIKSTPGIQSSLLDSAKTQDEMISESGLQLARSHGNLAWLARYKGDLANATENGETATALLKELVNKGTDEQKLRIRADLAGTLRQLADFYVELSNLDRANRTIDEALKESQSLVQKKPGVVANRIELANIEAVRAKTQFRAGKLKEARQAIEETQSCLAATSEFRDDQDFQHASISSKVLSARIYLKQNRPGDALTAQADLLDAFGQINALITTDPKNAEYYSDRAEIRALLAITLRAQNARDAANDHLARALNDQNDATKLASGGHLQIFKDRRGEIETLIAAKP